MITQAKITAPTIATIRAAFDADVARRGGMIANTRDQAGYADALDIARLQMADAKGWKQRILFDLLRETLTSDYSEAVRCIEVIEVCDGNGTEGNAIDEADSLLEFANGKYAVAEARA